MKKENNAGRQAANRPGDGGKMALLRGLLVCSVLLLSCICKQALGTRLLGGRENASPEEADVRRALEFAMNEYNRGSNDMYNSRVSEVVEVQKQIVSGIKYYFTVKIGRTVCRKGASDLENCAFHNTPKLAQRFAKKARPHNREPKVVSQDITIFFVVNFPMNRRPAPHKKDVGVAILEYIIETMTCTFEVYNIPWRNIISLEKNTCA